jgi:hypothetical protein
MKRFTSALGTFRAALALPVVLAGFFGMETLAGHLVSDTGIEVSPKFTGGPVATTIQHESWRTVVHRPVMEGLFRRPENGFVQVDWHPVAGGRLPARIDETIDLDGDGAADAQVLLDLKAARADIEALSPLVESASTGAGGWTGIGELIDCGEWRALRIAVRRPRHD